MCVGGGGGLKPPAKYSISKSTKFSISVGNFATFLCLELVRYIHHLFIYLCSSTFMTLEKALVAFIVKVEDKVFKNSLRDTSLKPLSSSDP